jgi:hypothetical protein
MPSTSGYSARLSKARITTPFLGSTDYTVTLDNCKTCSYKLGIDLIGQPMDDSSQSPNAYDEIIRHTDLLTINPLNLDNSCITDSYLKANTPFHTKDEAKEYDLALNIIKELRIRQHKDPKTRRIISQIPTIAIPRIQQHKFDELGSDPDSEYGADINPKKRKQVSQTKRSTKSTNKK